MRPPFRFSRLGLAEIAAVLGLVSAIASVSVLGGCQSEIWSCTNGVQDGAETGPDCGGGTCPACAIGLGCRVASDCGSRHCAQSLCAPPARCDDALLDGSETDVDCGGSCAPCVTGRHCQESRDCQSAICIAGTCSPPASCKDNRIDGRETDVDCGGGVCPGCPADRGCLIGSDCTSSICQAHVCQATTCSDGMKDGDESDVDCGGGTCPQCAPGGACLVPTDCQSSICLGGHCASIPLDCEPGYKKNDVDLCICNPSTCGSCCDVNEGNVCGLAFVPGGNNCGTNGQTCFFCDPKQLENCEHSDVGPDYCALACDAAQCAGCCSGLQNMNKQYCLHGDEDSECGTGGARCKQCSANEHCKLGTCVKGP